MAGTPIGLVLACALWRVGVMAAESSETFTDPEGDKFDARHGLLENVGFPPVPIIITEPAV